MVLMVAAACGFTFVSAGPAAACSCGGGTDAQAFASADVVFSGELIEVRTPPGDTYSSIDPERFVFDVQQVYKGDARAQQSVVTAREGASCGLELSGRGPFLVFAQTEAGRDFDIVDGELTSGLCTGSRELSEIPVPAEFGTGSPPDAGTSAIGEPDDDESRVPIVVGGAVLLVALAGASALALRRRVRRPATA
jgi:hypothetical protein